MSRKKARLLLIAILTAPLLWGIFNFLAKPVAIDLPYFGNKTVLPNGDTLYQEIEEFSFSDQNGVTINKDSVNGKILISNFFFCSCQGTCPTMNNNLFYVGEQFSGSDEVIMLSHTVNPERDSIPVLRQYTLERGYSSVSNWHFLTGSKKSIYDLAEYSYLAIADGESKEEFIHSKYITLVDAEGHIRGLFDGTKGIIEMKKLVDAVRVLTLEKRTNEQQKIK